MREGRPRTIEAIDANPLRLRGTKNKNASLITNSSGLSTHFQIYDNEEECSSCRDEEELELEPAGQGKERARERELREHGLPRARSERE